MKVPLGFGLTSVDLFGTGRGVEVEMTGLPPSYFLGPVPTNTLEMIYGPHFGVSGRVSGRIFITVWVKCGFL